MPVRPDIQPSNCKFVFVFKFSKIEIYLKSNRQPFSNLVNLLTNFNNSNRKSNKRSSSKKQILNSSTTTISIHTSGKPPVQTPSNLVNVACNFWVSNGFRNSSKLQWWSWECNQQPNQHGTDRILCLSINGNASRYVSRYSTVILLF